MLTFPQVDAVLSGRHQAACVVCHVVSDHLCLCDNYQLVVAPGAVRVQEGSYAADWVAIRLDPGSYPIEPVTLGWFKPQPPAVYGSELDPYYVRARIPGTVVNAWHGSSLRPGDRTTYEWWTYAYGLKPYLSRDDNLTVVKL